MKTKSFLLVFTCMIGLSIANYVQAQKTITGFEAPESVVKYGDKLFVSNIGGMQPNPMALDSNGFIAELSVDGRVMEKKFSKTLLNGPKGLAVAGNVLYTADINRVVGFDINSGQEVFELSIPEAGMLNDLCTVDDKTLVVSETIHNKVYLVNIPAKTFDFIGSINGANGVTYDAKTKQLFACGMGVQMDGKGKLYVKDVNSKDTVFTELPNNPTGIFDGLEMIDNDHLLVTDWISMNSNKGRFVVYDLRDHTNKVYPVDAGPADVTYDKASHIFYLPQMMKNSLLIESLSGLKAE
jgi:hypothetical protein